MPAGDFASGGPCRTIFCQTTLGPDERTGGTNMKKIARLLTVIATTSIALAACSTSAANRTANRTSEGIDDAVLSPFEDLNLTRAPIPPRLEAIVSPYEPVPILTCEAIGAEVGELTAILGPDSDAHLAKTGISEKAADGAADLTLNTVSSTLSGFLPYRSVLRFASGASEHERKLKAAYDRGVERRAYLKGIGAAMGCAPPAAPHPDAGLKPAPDIELR
ncbi:MAG: hypothetical protein R3C52_13255 [Hyphomonadaceae bacterium]